MNIKTKYKNKIYLCCQRPRKNIFCNIILEFLVFPVCIKKKEFFQNIKIQKNSRFSKISSLAELAGFFEVYPIHAHTRARAHAYIHAHIRTHVLYNICYYIMCYYNGYYIMVVIIDFCV